MKLEFKTVVKWCRRVSVPSNKGESGEDEGPG